MSLTEGGYVQRWGRDLGCGHVHRGGDGGLGGMSRGGARGFVQGVLGVSPYHDTYPMMHVMYLSPLDRMTDRHL